MVRPYWKNQKERKRKICCIREPQEDAERGGVRLNLCTRQTVECIMEEGD